MVLRVTFDTNVIDLACRPDRFPKDPRQPQLRKVREALAAGTIEGCYSVTMLTIEGIMRKDRAEVFATTKAKTLPAVIAATKSEDIPETVRVLTAGSDGITIKVKQVVEQPNRKPLHPEVVARVQAAQALGVRVLKAVPRIGAYRIDDPGKEFYLSNGEGDALGAWIEKAHELARAIEGRGLGIAQVKVLGLAIAGDPATSWFSALDQTKDIHQERAVERAFSEWADADSIAAHVAYGLDVFCSADVGNSNATNSVLDAANRAWLTETYGVRFMSFDDLLASLP